MKKISIVILCTLIAIQSFGQSQPLGIPPANNVNAQANASWYRGGNNATGTSVPGANRLGTRWNSDIWLMTNSNDMGRFTQGDALFGLNANGDGLELINRQPSTGPAGIGNIAIFTSPGFTNGTEIRMGLSGNIRGANNRFEIWGRYQGLYFNTPEAVSRTKFAHGGTVTGLIGENNYWLIGLQSDASNLNGVRRLHVFDTQAQFRLSFGGQNQSTGLFTDFLSNNAGNLQIMPANGRVAINLNANPTANLDVNGDARIRDVQTAVPDALFVGVQAGGANDMNVRRLDFSGNANQVLLGNGTWGTAPGAVTAQNAAFIAPGGQVEWGTNPLIHSTNIPMSGYNVLFNTGTAQNGTVTFGGGTYLNNARVNIVNDTYVSGLSVNSNFPSPIGTKFGINAVASNAVNLYAILGRAFTGERITGVQGSAAAGTTYNRGVTGVAIGTPGLILNYGGYFNALGGSYLENVGTYGYANGNIKTNIGGKFIAGNTGSFAIGVYGEADSVTVNGGNNSGWAGYFAGNVVITGATVTPSDSTLKQNIVPMDAALDSLLMLVEPVSFEYLQSGNAAELNLEGGQRFGILAQQIEPIFPQTIRAVTHPAQYDSLGVEIYPEFTYKAVDITQLIPLMLHDLQRKTIREAEQNAAISNLQNTVTTQQATIDDLNDRLSLLESCLLNILPELCNANNNAIQQTPEQTQQELRSMIDVELRKGTSIVLDQNVPNPFAERTVIMYSIPSTVGKAQMHFYNGSGELINTVDINERGDGQLNVFASDLSSGVYTYSLVADGKVVATRRMVKQ